MPSDSIEDKVIKFYHEFHNWSRIYIYSEYDFRFGESVIKIRGCPSLVSYCPDEVIFILHHRLAYKDYPFGGLTSSQDYAIQDKWLNLLKSMSLDELVDWSKENSNQITFPDGKYRIVGEKRHGVQIYGDEIER